MLDVGQYQFLVLLFVIEAKFQQREDFSPRPIIGIRDQGFHGSIHVVAIGVDVFQRRSRQKPAFWTFVARPDGLVIGIKEKIIIGVEFFVTGGEGFQNKCLEKPRRMGLVPLRRADIGHRLNALVFARQRRTQVHGPGAHGGNQHLEIIPR